MTELILPCPAKLNLFLHILGQNAEGYHLLQTVFQLLDSGDTLTISHNDSGKIQISPNIPGLAAKDNLIYKAAQLLQQHTGCTQGATMQLSKILPMGGGIGGGSSNAASALLGLNKLWRCELSIDELAMLGRSLGADVPVFVRGQTAWAEGIGEKLQPLNMETRWFVVLAPNCHVSTKAIFSHKDLTRDTTAITVAAFLEKGGKNDCQPLVERLFPQVRDAVDWLNQYGSAQLTGTGACVFASFKSEDSAWNVFANRPKHINGFVAKGINDSPLHQCLT
ncbi:4-(cytidine 5'-diphospho)-2-C-methyl-D-erythritol kinase [Teredinibacter waterburyi]|uniref:4-(cytidine 5'-diphospho)-2-C-methyl-D-erythritol kinase n=1 Tax=Teredinibacter waterburyi TaxID=1500538 RepID=UPI00165F37D4|nr:4-(cytidine 5'-diphospho)-2-C-methyl-D-erythritol kinase [Teredinibacter waterburyi]